MLTTIAPQPVLSPKKEEEYQEKLGAIALDIMHNNYAVLTSGTMPDWVNELNNLEFAEYAKNTEKNLLQRLITLRGYVKTIQETMPEDAPRLQYNCAIALEILIDRGFDVNQKNHVGNPLLHIICNNQFKDFFDILIRKVSVGLRPVISLIGTKGKTPLQITIEKETHDPHFVNVLLNHFPEQISKEDKQAALQFFAKKGLNKTGEKIYKTYSYSKYYMNPVPSGYWKDIEKKGTGNQNQYYIGERQIFTNRTVNNYRLYSTDGKKITDPKILDTCENKGVDHYVTIGNKKTLVLTARQLQARKLFLITGEQITDPTILDTHIHKEGKNCVTINGEETEVYTRGQLIYYKPFFHGEINLIRTPFFKNELKNLSTFPSSLRCYKYPDDDDAVFFDLAQEIKELNSHMEVNENFPTLPIQQLAEMRAIMFARILENKRQCFLPTSLKENETGKRIISYTQFVIIKKFSAYYKRLSDDVKTKWEYGVGDAQKYDSPTKEIMEKLPSYAQDSALNEEESSEESYEESYEESPSYDFDKWIEEMLKEADELFPDTSAKTASNELPPENTPKKARIS